MGYSIVVPTMWKYPPFVEFLKDLVNEFLVREIIIINNDKDKTPEDDILKHPKIKMWWFQEGNIGVNPAWNFGVHNASEDKICIMNDDIIFDIKIFAKLFDRLDNNSGAYGICPGDPVHGQIPVTNGIIEFQHTPEPYNYSRHFGFGQLMFVNKHNWTPVPPGLLVYWGDNFIYDVYHHKTNNNHLINNMFFYTPCASTTGTLLDPASIVQREGIIYNQVMPDIVKSIIESKQ